MKKLIFTILFLSFISIYSYSQPVFYQESFESYDSLTLPAGWQVWNNASFPIDPMTNWTIRDSGVCVPGVDCARTSKAYDGHKSIMVSWWSSVDSGTGASTVSDAWLVSKRFMNIPSDAYLSFYTAGGSTSYMDSVQVWLSNTDPPTPAGFTTYLGTIAYPRGSVYGLFQEKIYDLAAYAGQNVRIALRYYMDCAFDGFCVYVDLFSMYGTVGIRPNGSQIPTKFELKQNFPNPFNPSTTIQFDLAKNTNVKIDIYNNLGQLVKSVYNGYSKAGSFESIVNMNNMPSGIYYYQLVTDYYSMTKKMVLVK